MAELSNLDKKMMASDIKESYQQVQAIWKSAIEKSIAFGGKLDYCKSQIEHGKWLKFLEYCGVPERTASGMMRMHKHRELLREKSAENWIDADRLIRAETNPNRQRIADLTAVGVVSNPVPKLDAKALLGPSNQVVIEQPKSVPEFTSEVPPLETSNEPLKAGRTDVPESANGSPSRGKKDAARVLYAMCETVIRIEGISDSQLSKELSEGGFFESPHALIGELFRRVEASGGKKSDLYHAVTGALDTHGKHAWNCLCLCHGVRKGWIPVGQVADLIEIEVRAMEGSR